MTQLDGQAALFSHRRWSSPRPNRPVTPRQREGVPATEPQNDPWRTRGSGVPFYRRWRRFRALQRPGQGQGEFVPRTSRRPPPSAPPPRPPRAGLGARVTAAQARSPPGHGPTRPAAPAPGSRPRSPHAPGSLGALAEAPHPPGPPPRPPRPRHPRRGRPPSLTRSRPAARSARACRLCACALPPPRPGGSRR